MSDPRALASRRVAAGAALLLLSGLALTACSTGNAEDARSTAATTAPSSPSTPSSVLTGTATTGGDSSAPAVQPGVLTANVHKGATGVPVDKVLNVTAANAELTHVTVSSKAGPVAGTIASDGRSWTATDLLEPGTSYRLKAVGQGEDGATVTRRADFTTQDLTLDQQTYPTVVEAPKGTYGVGMPVIVHFDVPVTDKAAFQKHMTVTSTPAQVGSWNWVSDTDAHWRPKTYWQAHTTVHVGIDINSVDGGDGIYGQENRDVDFKIGDAHVYKVDAKTDQMRVFSNGKLLRTIPITTGMPGFETRSGVKVIVEKFASKEMNSETIGIPQGAPNSYDIDNVQWAMRLTYSGEFIHAAPWSVYAQGHENVSHGCTGMSTDNALWLYDMTNIGDVVEYTGTDKQMTLDNGYGDWNESYHEYTKGSAA